MDFAGVCEQTRAAAVVLHHTKMLSVDEDLTMHCSRGSTAFLAAVVSQIVIDIPDPRPNLRDAWRRLQVLGENLGIAPKPVGFRISDAGLTFGEAPKRPPKPPTEKDDAEAWLRGRMKPGEVYKASEIIDAAVQHGHAERTVRKAVTEKLGVKPKPVRKDGKIAEWEWVVPVPGGKS